MATRLRFAARTLVVLLAVSPSALGFTGANWLCHAVAGIPVVAHAVLAEAAGSGTAHWAHEPARAHDETTCDLCRASCAGHNASLLPCAPATARAHALRDEAPSADFAFLRDEHLSQPPTRAPPRIRA